jgi:hypothetical protein
LSSICEDWLKREPNDGASFFGVAALELDHRALAERELEMAARHGLSDSERIRVARP